MYQNSFFVRHIFITVFLVFHIIIQAQVSKSLEASLVKNAPVIDGILSDEIWKDLDPATDFTLIWPETRQGKNVPKEYETTIMEASSGL